MLCEGPITPYRPRSTSFLNGAIEANGIPVSPQTVLIPTGGPLSLFILQSQFSIPGTPQLDLSKQLSQL
ncbi:hypothetical protein BV898_19327 [Hypsibius exemplaris]|uniref:Uncharacterized protein n=1 Tax=Hypsibius exemplaris TaxID=2072580 RepID=A0A9X6NJ23_HYPEX|nr:hypothetical protein BV898_19327 [Hypsibius exemplaris]